MKLYIAVIATTLFSCSTLTNAEPIIKVPNPVRDVYIVRTDSPTAIRELVKKYGGRPIQQPGSDSAVLFEASEGIAVTVAGDSRAAYVAQFNNGEIVEKGLQPDRANKADSLTQYLSSAVSSVPTSCNPLGGQETGESFKCRMAVAHRYARSQGYASGVPTFQCGLHSDPKAEGWSRMKCGTIFLTTIAAEYRLVSREDLGSPNTDDIGSMFRAASNYGGARGYPGAFPTFEKVVERVNNSTSEKYAIVLMRSEGVDWRDVPRSELPKTSFDAWHQRVRDVDDFAIKQGYNGGLPNWHEANYGKGPVYGTFFFKTKASYRVDLPGILYDELDHYQEIPTSGTWPVTLKRHGPNNDCGDRSTYCGPVNIPGGDASINGFINTTGFLAKFLYRTSVDNSRPWDSGDIWLQPNDSHGFAPQQSGGTLYVMPTGGNLPTDRNLNADVAYSLDRARSTSGQTPLPPFAPSSPIPFLYYHLAPLSAEGKVADVRGTCGRDSQIQIWGAHGGGNQQYGFVPAEGNTYFIQSRASGMVLSTRDGVTVQQYDRIPGAINLRFELRYVGGGFQIAPQGSNKALQVEFDSQQDGSRVVLADFQRTSNQIWRLEMTFSPFNFLSTSLCEKPWQPGSTAPVAQGDKMRPGEVLRPGQSIRSSNGRYSLILQTDGNLVLKSREAPIWASGTWGKPVSACVMEQDGNLVLYGTDGSVYWASKTSKNPGNWLIVQDDGNLVMYRPDRSPIWASNTREAQGEMMRPGEVLYPGQSIIRSANGRYALILQTDGNLVLKSGEKPIWASGTWGKPVLSCVMQQDGNLVLYGADNTAYWASNTSKNPGNWLIVQDDANLVMYRPDGSPIWASNTRP